MDLQEETQSTLTIALYIGLYMAFIMERYGGHNSALIIAIHRGIYIAIVIDRYAGTQSTLTIALQ
jgi:hypothetical protein